LQNIFVHDVKKSNQRAIESLNRGAESIRFTIESETISIEDLMQNLPLKDTTYYFHLPFLSIDFATKVSDYAAKHHAKFMMLIDPIGQLAKDGNWFESLEKDIEKLDTIAAASSINFLSITTGIYQNAGANIVQQLAYTLAHVNEYFNRIAAVKHPITIEVAVGTNYFFEIAKLRALRILFNTLKKNTITISIAISLQHLREETKHCMTTTSTCFAPQPNA